MDELPNSIEQYGDQVKQYYITRGPDRIFDSDEYTCSEHYSPYYGQLIADRIAEIARKYQAYKVIEVGGGRGQFAFDVLTRLREEHPDVFAQLSYLLVDVSYPLQLCQRQMLEEFSVEFVTASAAHLPFANRSFHNSIIISNEVLADLPSVIPTGKEEIPADVMNLAVEANITLRDDCYFNVGAFQFLLEISRVISSGAVMIIEYGVDEVPKSRVLGGKTNNHIEVAINKKDLAAAAEVLFSEVTVGPLIDLIGEKALHTMIRKSLIDLPDGLTEWLFNLLWMTERLPPRRLGSELINRIFLEGEPREEAAALQRIKFWQEKMLTIKVMNRYERIFLENLTALLISFDETFGHEAATQLFKGFQRLHQLGTKVLLEKTMYAKRTYMDKGYIDEDFFFLLCGV
jgi:hypothetical protein